jgi:predicted AAA+ superfamily ATPase
MFIDKQHLINWYIDMLEAYQWIRIVWPRWSGKTTILTELYNQIKETRHSYFINFDEYIIAKQFSDVDGFVRWLRQDYGVDTSRPCIICMNEIQYSKYIEEIIQQCIADPQYHITFITTGINGNNLTDRDMHSVTSCIYPCSMDEYIEAKSLPLTGIDRTQFSQNLAVHMRQYLIDFLCNGGYPAIMLAHTRDAKNQQIEILLRKLFDKDIGLQFSREKVILYQEYLKMIAMWYESPLSSSKLIKVLNITPWVLKKFEQFSAKNYLVTYLKPFYTNPTRELSQKLTPIFLDNCFVSYYNARMHATNYHLSRPILLWYLIQELLKSWIRQDQLMTYQKVNRSSIDCIVRHDNGTITPYVILDHMHPVRSKALYHFIQEYHHMIDRAVEISPRYLWDHDSHGIQVINMPSMMIM